MTTRAQMTRFAFTVIAGLAISQGLQAQCADNSHVGYYSSCFGNSSMAASTSSTYFDTGLGAFTLFTNTTGSSNTAVGAWALASNTTGAQNVGIGDNALGGNTTGTQNTALGSEALSNSTTGTGNTALGFYAMQQTSTGYYDTATGYGALSDNTTGVYNVAMGVDALFNNTTGSDNTAMGLGALQSLTTGSSNLALGFAAGSAYTGAESSNVLLANYGVAGDSNVMRLGMDGAQTTTFIAGISGVASASGVPVYINSSGQLGTATSSLRFKEDVADMGSASDELLALRPVTFRYKAPYDDGQRVLQYGLIAEEVAAVDPNLVQFGDDGRPLSVRYHFVNAMLLGEVQKQHAVQTGLAALIARQAAELASQQAEIAALAARLAKLEAALAPAP
jgi:hypothetical protein